MALLCRYRLAESASPESHRRFDSEPALTPAESASNQTITVTNDGATILKSIALDNPAAKILVNISKVQDDEVGDGTTSVCVLASELLREAEKLVTIQKIHPQTVVEGFRIASKAALSALEKSAVDHGKDEKKFREDLFNIARTTLSSKVLSQDKDYFANLAVDAVLRLKGSTDLEHIQIIKKVGGKLTDSYLDEGGWSVSVAQRLTYKSPHACPTPPLDPFASPPSWVVGNSDCGASQC
jgi:chaperonin GroEL (HSP60 family)